MKKTKKKRNSGTKSAVITAVIVCAVCILGIILLAQEDKEITQNEAYEIVLKDLGLKSEQVGSPHIHEGTYKNQSCYNIYVTVDGKSLTYVVSTKGEILYKGEGGHSH